MSSDLIESVGIDRPSVVPDPVLYFGAPAPSLPLGPRPRIGLNLAFSGRMTQDLLRIALRPIAAAMKEVVRRHQATIVYILHSNSEQAVPGWLNELDVHPDEHVLNRHVAVQDPHHFAAEVPAQILRGP
jgi:hypothetical protein